VHSLLQVLHGSMSGVVLNTQSIAATQQAATAALHKHPLDQWQRVPDRLLPCPSQQAQHLLRQLQGRVAACRLHDTPSQASLRSLAS